MARKVGVSWLGLGFFAVATACGGIQMKVPTEIASQSEVLVATDRTSWTGSMVDESFKLGPFAVKDVDRDWDTSSSFSVGNLSQKNTEGGYEFKFSGKGKKFVGHCAAEKSGTGIDLGKGFGLNFEHTKVACTCDGSAKQVSVIVDAGSGGDYKGVLTSSSSGYEVTSIRENQHGGTEDTPTGYRMDGEAAVGAAEVTHPGRIWLDKRLADDERAEVACLFVGLMLYQPKREEE
jgi:hypothetical protein